MTYNKVQNFYKHLLYTVYPCEKRYSNEEKEQMVLEFDMNRTDIILDLLALLVKVEGISEDSFTLPKGTIIPCTLELTLCQVTYKYNTTYKTRHTTSSTREYLLLLKESLASKVYVLLAQELYSERLKEVLDDLLETLGCHGALESPEADYLCDEDHDGGPKCENSWYSIRNGNNVEFIDT